MVYFVTYKLHARDGKLAKAHDAALDIQEYMENYQGLRHMTIQTHPSESLVTLLQEWEGEKSYRTCVSSDDFELLMAKARPHLLENIDIKEYS